MGWAIHHGATRTTLSAPAVVDSVDQQELAAQICRCLTSCSCRTLVVDLQQVVVTPPVIGLLMEAARAAEALHVRFLVSVHGPMSLHVLQHESGVLRVVRPPDSTAARRVSPPSPRPVGSTSPASARPAPHIATGP